MSDISTPSGAGRSPYHSEPSIEAPDSNTPTRHVNPEIPASTGNPVRRHTVVRSTTDHPVDGASPIARQDHAAGPTVAVGARTRVRAGFIARGCGHLPKSPGETALNSAVGR
jgi:hypothetical protein